MEMAVKRVVVAMSGGVDSSVAAALLKEQGYQVIGVTMNVWQSGGEPAERFGGCCGRSDIEDARQVCHRLGIPHYALDFREIFAREVIDYFCREYAVGRTPNPCIRCNRSLKFETLLRKARGLGADLIATGHYARIEKAGGRYLLKKGLDACKDQSYVLYQMTREQLAHVLMPVGGLTKDEVRSRARELVLPVAEKPESQDICFALEGGYPAFLAEKVPESVRPGPIVDQAGRQVGSHRGISFYTVGQRRGLGLAEGEPRYVTAIRPEDNTVVIGSRESRYGKALVASELNWVSIAPPETPFEARAKIRYRHPEAPAFISPLDDDRVRVEFEEPQMAITPGQAVVFYDGDSVIGGGTIERAIQHG